MNFHARIGRDAGADGTTRVFLFLQPHPSFFCRDLVRRMRALGATCHVVNLSLGDWLFRRGLGAVAYRGRFEDWERWLGAFCDAHGVTDIVYYADQRPYHRVARRLARRRGLDAHAYEFGYLRPDWITLEQGGMGAFSHFPNDPATIRALAAALPEDRETRSFPYGFLPEAVGEVLYTLPQTLFPFAFPHYRRDRYWHPLVEYPSYVPKLLRRRARDRAANRAVEALRTGDAPYSVVIMQMQGDYQVRRASRYARLDDMVEEVMASFAAHAPAARRLAFKLHPLENGIVNRRRRILRAAARHGLSGRVDVLDGGNLVRLFERCAGVVLLNSTAGLHALRQGVPVKALGVAVYDVAGLTFQGPLDRFWREGARPDAALLGDFLRLLRAGIQVKGNFFTREGRAAAVEGVATRLMTGTVNGHGTFVVDPPRLRTARAAGVPMILEDA